MLESKETIRFKSQVMGKLFLVIPGQATKKILPGKTVDLNAEEIEYLDTTSKIFSDGCLVEVSKEPVAINNTENNLSDEKIMEILDMHWKKAVQKVNEITSITILSRMLYLAKQEGKSYAVVSSLEDRLKDMRKPAKNE